MSRACTLAALALVACRDPAPPSLFTPAPSAAPAPPTGLRFEDHGGGVTFRHHAGRTEQRWMPEVMGGGVAMLDVDRDGDADLLFADSGHLPAPQPGDGPRLYLNDGRGQFTDATAAWGLVARGYGMGVASGDVDRDGYPDVYLTTFDGHDRLLRNTGRGFEDVTAAWGIDHGGWSTSAAFFDPDGDGDLDLYVARYIDYTTDNALRCSMQSLHVYCTPALYAALPDAWYRNEGSRFVHAEREAGLYGIAEKGLAVGTGDVDGDGDVDLYVANDTTRNLLLRNDGRGRFEETGGMAGVAYSELGREEASMGVSFGDADADGRWDIAVSNFQGESTSVYLQRGAALFLESADRVGVGASSRGRLSFGLEWFDADNDGDEDLLVASGHIADNVAEYRDGVSFAQPNSLYEAVGPARLVDRSEVAGPALLRRGVSRGLAVGDLDGDGGLDYVVVDSEGPAQVARNASSRGHWLSLWLERGEHRATVGAVAEVTVAGRTQRREVRGASSYLSVSDRRLHFGLGDAAEAQVVVRWPDGSAQDLGTLQADRHLHLIQGGAPRGYVPGEAVIAP